MRTNLKRLISTAASALICLGLIIGCNRVPSPLEEADLVIEDHPDSALAILREVDTVALTKERDKALYGLLLTQAKVKKRFKDIDTTLAGSARRYFNLHPEKDYRLRANYYSAYRQYLDSCYNPSIEGAANSYLEAEDMGNSLWMARSAELIGFIFNRLDHSEVSIKYDSIAYFNYKKCGKELNAIYSALDLGIDLTSAMRHKEADQLFNSLLNYIIKKYPDDKNLITYVMDPAITVKIKLGQFDCADSLINRKFEYVKSKSATSTNYASLARIELNRGNLDKGKNYLDSAYATIERDFDKEQYYIVLRNYYLKKGDLSMEGNILRELYNIANETKRSHDLSPVNSILMSIIDNHHDGKIKNIGSEKTRTYILYISSILIVLVFLGIVTYKYIKKKRENKIKDDEIAITSRELNKTLEIVNDRDVVLNDLNDELSELRSSADKSRNDYNEKIEAISNILKKEIPIINDLCETLPELEGPQNNIAQRATILKDKIEKKLKDKDLSWVVSSADFTTDGMPSRLKEACPELKEKYLILFSLYCLGFSTKAAGTFQNIKRNAVDQRKKRLKEAIINSCLDDEEKESFLNIIN